MQETVETVKGGLPMAVVDHPAGLKAFGRAFVMALGVFDGVHLGHQAILRELTELGKTLDATPVALFFEPHPRMVLQPAKAPLRICGMAEKLNEMRRHGVDCFVCLPFTRELAGMSPEEFCREYFQLEGCEIRGFCVGENWRFGRMNAGDGNTLRELTGKTVRIVPSVTLNGEVVSSTRIREALEAGDIRLAAAMLGRPVTLDGEVRHGQQLGGTVLSCPTANIAGDGLQLPRFGVYAARGHIGGTALDGIVYVGDAPTLRGRDVVVELHLFDFSGDLYGRRIQIEFVEYLRGSVRFGNPEALRRQIESDIARAKSILAIS